MTSEGLRHDAMLTLTFLVVAVMTTAAEIVPDRDLLRTVPLVDIGDARLRQHALVLSHRPATAEVEQTGPSQDHRAVIEEGEELARVRPAVTIATDLVPHLMILAHDRPEDRIARDETHHHREVLSVDHRLGVPKLTSSVANTLNLVLGPQFAREIATSHRALRARTE